MNSTQTHYPSFIAFVFFAIGAMFIFSIASILGFSALMIFLDTERVDVQITTYLVSFSFLGTLLVTASVISFIRFINNPTAEVTVTTSLARSKVLIGIIAIGLILLTGHFMQSSASVNWLATTLLTLPAVALPIWLILRVGTKDLLVGSRWRMWGIFGLSMSYMPFLLFVLEVMVFVFIFIVAIIYIVASPERMGELELFSRQFMFIDPESNEAIDLIMPYLTNPGAIIIAFTLFSLIVPVMEEALKPLGVWLLAGKLKTQAHGFALGALCGAGFALVETLNISGQTDQWAGVLFARIGTGAMHITTSALMGAGIVSAWHEKRYLRLFSTYLFAIFIHGLWNAVALINGFSTILASGQPDRAHMLLTASTIGLVILTLGLFTILLRSNLHHRKNNNDVMVATIPGMNDDDGV